MRKLGSMRQVAAAAVMALGVVACGSDGSPPADTPDAGDGPPPGYTRYKATPMTLQPGQSGIWAEYVAPPLTEDMDVVDIIGTQGPGGHHAIMYSSTEAHPVGEVHEWSGSDQLTVRFLGGSGGEGVGSIRLPEGLSFRVRKGNSLLMQVHYINVTDAPLVMNSTIDIKLEPANPNRKVAGLYTNVEPNLSVPVGDYTATRTCTLQSDLDLVMMANHLHEWGTAVNTTAVLPGGQEIELVNDPAWFSEWVINPNFTTRSVDDPLHLPKGTVIKTKCSWKNDKTTPIDFPDEMCVFFGFHAGGFDVNCVADEWEVQ